MRFCILALLASGVFGIVGCAEGYDDSDITARVSDLEHQVAALSAATPAAENVIVIARETRDIVSGNGLVSIPLCVIYKVAGSEQEQCWASAFYTADANVTTSDRADFTARNERLSACWEQVTVGGPVPECWWSAP